MSRVRTIAHHRATKVVVALAALTGFLLLDDRDSNRFLAFLGLAAVVREWLKDDGDNGPTWEARG